MRRIIVIVSMLLAGLCWAQEAPVGNAHPEAKTPTIEGLSAPFGPPLADSAMSVEERLAFAAALDLEPLRDLAVFHGGRVKVLDTLARETVGAIAGRDRIEVFTGEVGSRTKHSFDPLFSLLDFAIDPAWYADKAIVHVEYLPLRRAIIEGEMPVPDGASPEEVRRIEQMRDLELRLTRVTPMAVLRQAPRIEQEHTTGPWLEGLNRLRRAINRFATVGDTMLLVAPESVDDVWHHVREHGFAQCSEVEAICDDLGSAWRAGDAQGVNDAARRLAQILPTINSDLYPTMRRSIELVYNRADLFTWGYWFYLLGAVLLVVAMTTGRRALRIAGVSVFTLAVALHATGFVARCLIAERWAIQNQFESMIGVSLFGALLAGGLMLGRRNVLYGAAGAAMGFLVLLTATEAQIPGKTIGREAAILNTSVLLKYHVTTVLTSYGLITLGFVLSLFFLAGYYAKRLRERSQGEEATSSRAISGRLRDLDRATMTVLQLAFWTLGVGILLGAWWADHSWGRWWAFDPKETWSLATWIIYLIVIHVRPVAKNRELATAWLSVLGFVVMLWTYFGVNLLLPGLHSYA